MDDIWSVLQIQKTKKAADIKRAYARMSQQYHPEEEPELFLRLRNAYKAALAYAAEGQNHNGGDSFGQTEEAAESGQEEEHKEIKQNTKSAEEAEQTGAEQNAEPAEAEERKEAGGETGRSDEPEKWGFSVWGQETEENPYIDYEANQNFLELYCGKQRKDRKRWTDYFTSAAFLEVCREKEFTALLLEEITEREQEYPLNREFLAGLYLAYLFTAKDAVYIDRTERHFNILDGAGFDGLDSILQIAARGPLPKRFDGNDTALSAGYMDYWQLVSLAENNRWTEWALSELEQILGRYVMAYIKDKCEGEYARPPVCLRLLDYFFASRELPEEAYRILWRRLDLKNARMGRAKLFYGRLREIALEHLPELEKQQEESFRQLHEVFAEYSSRSLQRAGAEPEKDKEETDILFAREDFRRALRNRRMVELYVVNVWLSKQRCTYFLEQMLEFYQENPDAPYAEQVIRQTEELLRQQEASRQDKEDEAAVPADSLSLAERPFFRYWLNVSLYTARDLKTGVFLRQYLKMRLPYSSEWTRRFLDFDEESGRFNAPRSRVIFIGGMRCELFFHLYYIEYRVDNEEVFRPFLTWEQLKTISSADDFFLLLPMALTAYDAYPQVRGEIVRRLADTAAPGEDIPVIGGCLAGSVCRLYRGEETGEENEFSKEERSGDHDSEECFGEAQNSEDGGLSSIPMEIYEESPEFLYGCEWWEQIKVLFVFKQTAEGRSYLPHGRYDHIADAGLAVTLAKRLLTDLFSASGINPMLMEPLPDFAYASRQYAPVRCFNIGEVTEDCLKKLLEEFAGGELMRLEFSWSIEAVPANQQAYPPGRSLVFLQDKGLYACLYFDDEKAACYSLLSLPEVYRTVDHKDVVSTAFGESELPDYCIHHSFISILRNLDDVFSQTGRGEIAKKANGEMLWSTPVYGKRHQYNMYKQQLGAFPVERAHNSLLAKFILSQYPVSIETIDMQGVRAVLQNAAACRQQAQQELARFMQGTLQKLRLTWKIETKNNTEGCAFYFSHLVLMQDNGRYVMAYLRDDKKSAEYYVADRRVYLDVEGKKYPKDTFCGRTMPTYLIHNGLQRIRNCLDLMFVNIAEPSAVTERFGDFAGEKPVKPRSYEEIRASLVAE